MAQNLKELDRLMTDAAFTQLTGINNKTPMEEAEKLFEGVDPNEVFEFGPIKQCVLHETFEISPDERKFLRKLYKFKHLIDSAELIGLCESIDACHLRRIQSDILKIRLLKKTSENKRDANKVGKRYHISSLYYQICDSQANHASAIVYRLLQNADLNCMDEIIYKEQVWQQRKKLAACRAGIVTYWLNKPGDAPPITECELILFKTRI